MLDDDDDYSVPMMVAVAVKVKWSYANTTPVSVQDYKRNKEWQGTIIFYVNFLRKFMSVADSWVRTAASQFHLHLLPCRADEIMREIGSDEDETKPVPVRCWRNNVLSIFRCAVLSKVL